MTDVIKILAIEDDPEHRKDLEEVVGEVTATGARVEVDYVSCLKDAIDAFDQKQGRYDGILSDVFFPYNKGEGPSKNIARLVGMMLKPTLKYWETHRHEEIQEAYDMMLAGETMHPSGVLIAEEAYRNGVPVVLCSDIYHHDASLELVITKSGKTGWHGPFRYYVAADGVEVNGRTRKKWGLALVTLLDTILVKKVGVTNHRKSGFNEDQKEHLAKITDRYGLGSLEEFTFYESSLI